MKFSVVIPVYNKANTIRRSLDSVYAQSFQDYEIIIVDDGSGDNLSEVLNAYSGLNVVRQKNSGVSVARNTGILRAQGDYVCFLDADDSWHENHLQELSRMIDSYPSSGVYVTSHIISFGDNKGSIDSNIYLGDGDNLIFCPNLLELINQTSDSIIHTNSICIQRNILLNENCFFEPGIRIGEDTDLWYRVALRHPVVISRTATTTYHREDSTATRDSSFTADWIFWRRESAILADATISQSVKDAVQSMLDRYRLNSARELAVRGDDAKAREMLTAVVHKSGKRYWLSVLFCCLPKPLRKIVFQKIMK